MSPPPEGKRLRSLLREIAVIQKTVLAFEAKHHQELAMVCPENLPGARNLLHYLAFRQLDLKSLQTRLSFLGLSSLGRCESFVLESLREVHERLNEALLARGMKGKAQPLTLRGQTWVEAELSLHRHSRVLLGQKPNNRHVYVMVTAPDSTEVSAAWVRQLLLAGTNLIRINCAHENPLAWKEMIGTIRAESKNLKLPVSILMDLGGPKLRIESPGKIKVRSGDEIRLLKKKGHGHDWLTIGVPLALNFVRKGQRVSFDDGKVLGHVFKSGKQGIHVKITRTAKEEIKLRAGKGVNFPDSHLKIPELTEDDVDHLEFVAHYADLVGLSFAQTSGAIRRVRKELKKHSAKMPGLVLKIETKAGFQNLPRLLLEAMRGYPVGVMIARGDLAVEAGFERMAELQEEILWLCEAAHVPAIWATQVLENLAKTGQPSRAEITDAGFGVRAECVMLNKGPFITDAVRTLDDVLCRMEHHFYKKRNLNRPLNVAKL